MMNLFLIAQSTFEITGNWNHGRRIVKREQWTPFLKSVNAPRRKDLRSLTGIALYRTWFGAAGRMKLKTKVPARSTFYANVKKLGVTFRRPSKVPRLSHRNIYERQVFAELEVELLDTKAIKNYIDRIIFFDSAIFTLKGGSPFEAGKMRVATYGKNPPLRSYSEPDRTEAHEGFGAVAVGDRTDLVFVQEKVPEKRSKPGQQFVIDFIEEQIVPMANRMRQRLGLPEDAKVYIMLDGAGVMQAKRVWRTLESHHICLGGLSRKTPECNIIEDVWNMSKTELRGTWMGKGGTRRFFKAVKAAWDSLQQDSIDRLCRSYEGRVRALKAAEGRNFKYRGQRARALFEQPQAKKARDESSSSSEDEGEE